MEVLKDIAAAIGLILSVVSLLTLCTKGGRSLIAKMFAKNTHDIVEENRIQTQNIKEIKDQLDVLLRKVGTLQDFSMQQCRNTIKTIYYAYVNEQRIPLYERKTADFAYKIYTEEFNGNSYASLLYEEIVKWPVDAGGLRDVDDMS